MSLNTSAFGSVPVGGQVTEKRTVITTSSSSVNNDDSLHPGDFFYRSSITPRNTSIQRATTGPLSPGLSGGGSRMSRTVEISSGYSTPLYGGSVNIANSEVTGYKNNREREKRDMRDLNERFANYIEKVRFLEAQNRKLASELDDLRSKWGKETSAVRVMYETELDEARKVIDDTTKEKNRLQVRVGQLEEQLDDYNTKLDDAKKWRAQDRETINKLNQQISDLEAEIRMLRRTNDSLDTERQRDKQVISRLNEELEKLRMDLSNETIQRLDADNRAQTLAEELEFLKSVHEQELKELAGLAYRDTTAENREFWKNELSQAIRDIQNEYDSKLDTIRSEMETFYNLKVQEFRTGATKQNMEVTHAREETKKIHKMLNDCKIRMADLEARNAQLEKQYQELLREMEQKDQDHMLEINQMKDEMNKLRTEMEGMLTELQTLMDAKLSLELEIAAYRKLLETEESRTGLPSRRHPRSTVTAEQPVANPEKPSVTSGDKPEKDCVTSGDKGPASDKGKTPVYKSPQSSPTEPKKPPPPVSESVGERTVEKGGRVEEDRSRSVDSKLKKEVVEETLSAARGGVVEGKREGVAEVQSPVKEKKEVVEESVTQSKADVVEAQKEQTAESRSPVKEMEKEIVEESVTPSKADVVEAKREGTAKSRSPVKEKEKEIVEESVPPCKADVVEAEREGTAESKSPVKEKEKEIIEESTPSKADVVEAKREETAESKSPVKENEKEIVEESVIPFKADVVEAKTEGEVESKSPVKEKEKEIVEESVTPSKADVVEAKTEGTAESQSPVKEKEIAVDQKSESQPLDQLPSKNDDAIDVPEQEALSSRGTADSSREGKEGGGEEAAVEKGMPEVSKDSSREMVEDVNESSAGNKPVDSTELVCGSEDTKSSDKEQPLIEKRTEEYADEKAGNIVEEVIEQSVSAAKIEAQPTNADETAESDKRAQEKEDSKSEQILQKVADKEASPTPQHESQQSSDPVLSKEHTKTVELPSDSTNPESVEPETSRKQADSQEATPSTREKESLDVTSENQKDSKKEVGAQLDKGLKPDQVEEVMEETIKPSSAKRGESSKETNDQETVAEGATQETSSAVTQKSRDHDEQKETVAVAKEEVKEEKVLVATKEKEASPVVEAAKEATDVTTTTEKAIEEVPVNSAPSAPQSQHDEKVAAEMGQADDLPSQSGKSEKGGTEGVTQTTTVEASLTEKSKENQEQTEEKGQGKTSIEENRSETVKSETAVEETIVPTQAKGKETGKEDETNIAKGSDMKQEDQTKTDEKEAVEVFVEEVKEYVQKTEGTSSTADENDDKVANVKLKDSIEAQLTEQDQAQDGTTEASAQGQTDANKNPQESTGPGVGPEPTDTTDYSTVEPAEENKTQPGETESPKAQTDKAVINDATSKETPGTSANGADVDNERTGTEGPHPEINGTSTQGIAKVDNTEKEREEDGADEKRKEERGGGQEQTAPETNQEQQKEDTKTDVEEIREEKVTTEEKEVKGIKDGKETDGKEDTVKAKSEMTGGQDEPTAAKDAGEGTSNQATNQAEKEEEAERATTALQTTPTTSQGREADPEEAGGEKGEVSEGGAVTDDTAAENKEVKLGAEDDKGINTEEEVDEIEDTTQEVEYTATTTEKAGVQAEEPGVEKQTTDGTGEPGEKEASDKTKQANPDADSSSTGKDKEGESQKQVNKEPESLGKDKESVSKDVHEVVEELIEPIHVEKPVAVDNLESKINDIAKKSPPPACDSGEKTQDKSTDEVTAEKRDSKIEVDVHQEPKRTDKTEANTGKNEHDDAEKYDNTKIAEGKQEVDGNVLSKSSPAKDAEGPTRTTPTERVIDDDIVEKKFGFREYESEKKRAGRGASTPDIETVETRDRHGHAENEQNESTAIKPSSSSGDDDKASKLEKKGEEKAGASKTSDKDVLKTSSDSAESKSVKFEVDKSPQTNGTDEKDSYSRIEGVEGN